jgi:anti-sigma factor RsiW
MNAPVVCATGVELITEYLEDALPAHVRRELDAHLSGCARCTAFVRSFRETPRIVREATLAAPPPGFEASLTAFLRRRRG